MVLETPYRSRGTGHRVCGDREGYVHRGSRGPLANEDDDVRVILIIGMTLNTS